MAVIQSIPREKQIFEGALDLESAEERLGYIKGACADDAALLARVRALLQAHAEASRFLSDAPGTDLEETVAAHPSDDSAPGDRIGRYKLLQQIGEGGMGAVYMAEQEEPVRRRVALKIIKLGMDTRQVVARFEAERQALAMMDHPNIARVLDGGATETGRPYFVMELVQGVPITEFCDKNKLTAQERMRLFIQVCQAIQSAHQKGIIHRDIKPSNVLVTLHHGEPMPKVIDFGIAKATNQKLTEKTLFTNHATMIGTPAYMSPEQAEMSSMDIDTRTDVYSLGVLLYELLTGSTPFSEKRLRSLGYGEMQRVIVDEEPERPSTRLSTMANEQKTAVAKNRGEELAALSKLLRGDLDWVVMRCLEKDRRRRYDTPNELVADIERHLNNEPVVARPPTVIYRFQKMVRRNKLAFAAGVAVFLALAVGLTLAAVGWFQARTQRDVAVKARAGEETQRKQAQANEQSAIQERQRAELAREENRRRAYVAEISAGFQALAENNLGRALDLLNRQRPKPGEEDLRGFEWRHLWQLCQSDAKATFGGARSRHPAFSPDGRWLAYGGDQIVIRELPSRAEVKTIPIAAKTAAFSPDSRLLASGHDSHVRLWSTESWEEEQSLPDARYPAVFSPDGQWLVTGAVGGYRVWSTRTWQPTGFCAGEAPFLWRQFHGVAFSPDGRFLVTAGRGLQAPQFHVWDFPALTVRTNFSSFAFELASAVFTPDSKQLLIGDMIGRLLVWDVAEGRVEETLNPHTGRISTITFSRDGRTMATSSGDRTLIVWDWETRKQVVRLRGHLGEILSSAISPDGQMLASDSQEGKIWLWDASTRRERRVLPECGLIIGFSADSRLLVVRGFNDIRSWRLADGVVTPIPLDSYLFGHDPRAGVHGLELYAVFGMTNGVLEHWNLATMSRVASWQVHEGAVSTAGFSPDGRFIATSGTNGGIKLWDAKTHREVKGFKALGRKLMSLTFSPDSRLLAGSTDYHKISPDGRVFIDSTENNERARVSIWDVNEGSLRELDGDSGLELFAFSPDGKLLATAHDDHNARLWEFPSGKLKATLKGHVSNVMDVAFSPDGKTLATGGYEGKVKLWNVATEQELTTLAPLPGGCLTLRFSPDGRALAAGSVLGPEPFMSLWQVPSFEEIDAVEAKHKAEIKQP